MLSGFSSLLLDTGRSCRIQSRLLSGGPAYFLELLLENLPPYLCSVSVTNHGEGDPARAMAPEDQRSAKGPETGLDRLVHHLPGKPDVK